MSILPCREACQLVVDTCELLNIPQNVLVCAQALYHQVKKHEKIMGIYMPYVPVTIVFVACKAEEHPCSLIQFLQVLEYFIVKQKIICNLNPYTTTGKELTASIRDHLITSEMMILRCLGFAVYSFADYPHKYIPSLTKKLCVHSDVMQCIWSVCNDAMYMDIHTRYAGLEIAFAAIAVGLDRLQQSFGEAFTQVIAELEVDPVVVIELIETIQETYKAQA